MKNNKKFTSDFCLYKNRIADKRDDQKLAPCILRKELNWLSLKHDANARAALCHKNDVLLERHPYR